MRRISRSVLMVLAVGMVSALPIRAQGQSFRLDSAHCFIAFEIRHAGVANAWGLAPGATGTIVLDSADPTKTRVDVEIKPEQIVTGNAQRDNHLRGPDFFDARQFPTITFKSTSAKLNGENIEITGDFTLKGVTKPLTITMKKTGPAAGGRGGARVGMETKFAIKRSEFSMGGMLNTLGDEVTLHVNLEGVGQ